MERYEFSKNGNHVVREKHVAPRDCWNYDFVFDLDRDRWVCSYCGSPYDAPQQYGHKELPEVRYWQPWKTDCWADWELFGEYYIY